MSTDEISADEILADVVVVGSGASGSGAALAATEAGATVVILEKRDEPGGSAAYSAGGFWTLDTREKFDEHAPLGDRAMQDKLLSQHHSAAESVRAMGLRVSEGTIPGGNGYGVGIAYTLDILGLMEAAREATVASGGQVLMETPVVGLLREEGRVVGVVGRRADGSTVHVRGHVVLATGGYQGDPEMLARYLGPNSGALLVRSNPGSTGDGFRLAAAEGAGATKNLANFYGHLISHPSESFGPDDYKRLTQYHAEVSIVVDLLGRRFADEGRGDAVLSQLILQRPDARGVLIFDDHVKRNNATDEPFPGVGQVDRFAEAVRSGARHAVADTLEALVKEIGTWGVDTATLQHTIDAYVDAANAGDGFADGVPIARHARAPQTAPFYAVEVQPAITFPYGGIRVSVDGEVLDRDGHPVPGLFAGGADVGGIAGGPTYVGGLAPCFITGSWAGAAAARAVG